MRCKCGAFAPGMPLCTSLIAQQTVRHKISENTENLNTSKGHMRLWDQETAQQSLSGCRMVSELRQSHQETAILESATTQIPHNVGIYDFNQPDVSVNTSIAVTMSIAQDVSASLIDLTIWKCGISGIF